MSKGNHTDVILEDINGKFDFLVEYSRGINERLGNMPTKDDLAQVNSRLQTLEYSIKNLSKEVHLHTLQFERLGNALTQAS